MNRLDAIEARLSALEGGGDIAGRLARIEEALGIGPGAAAHGFQPSAGTVVAESVQCAKCGNVVPLTADWPGCSLSKCPVVEQRRG